MASPAPPAAETKKPATPPPAKDDKAGKTGKPADGKARPGADQQAKGSAGAKDADKAAGRTAEKSAGKPEAKAAATDKAAAAGQQRFDRMAVRAKLAVSAPGDAVEREADAVAERVSRKLDAPAGGNARAGADAAAGAAAARPGTQPGANKPAIEATPAAISRKATGPTDADEKPDGPVDAENGARQNEAAPTPAASDAQARVKQQLGQGEPLADDVRTRMEREFGHDLSQVRIHQDGRADELCRSLGALAFTTGRDIFFASGRYQPASKAGTALLAHELTHVVQQQDSGPAIARKIDPDLDAKYKPKNDAATASALAELGKLEIPAVKARHLSLYTGLLGGKLKRKRGYDRGSPAQVDVWNKGVQITEAKIRARLAANKVDNVPTGADEPFKLILGGKARPQAKSIAQLQKLLKIPTWGRTGKVPGSGFQVDHIVELQVSGENGEGTGNSLQNMELLDQPSNSSSGGVIRSRIYSKVDTYLQSFKKPAPKRRTFLKQHDIVFEGVQANLKTGASASDAAWWSLADIQEAVPLDKVKPAPPSNEEGTATEFLFLAGPGGVVVQRFKHKAGENSFTPGGAAKKSISGLSIDSVTINDKAAGGSGTVGSISATWDLPAKWMPPTPQVTLSLSGDGKYRGYPAKLGKSKLHFAHLSDLELPEVTVDDGALSAEGSLTPSLPILKAPLRVTLNGRDIRFSLDYSAGQLAIGEAPGVSIDDAMISVSYSTDKGFSLGGGLDFSVDKVGGGSLKATFAEADGVTIAGSFDFDSELFDVAKVEAWWREGEGFGASGDLAITKPGKVKGLKSAALKAKYEKSAFTATGSAETDVPGITGVKAEIKFVSEDDFSITGSGDFDKLPGIDSGSLTLTVERVGGKEWKLSGSGNATPKLPGSTKASIAATYKEGLVTIKGKVELVYGKDLLQGKVDATVTNAASVDAAGNPSGEGGKSFRLFGNGRITATLGKISGTVDVDLLPDGGVRVGGGLTAPDTKLFDEYPPPKQGGEGPTLKPIASMPIPGLGFGVGGINVGVVLGAKWGYDAYASIGPGWAKNIRVTIAKFNPEGFKPSDIKVEDAGADLEIPATAGVSLSAAIELTLEAPAVRGGARLTATAAAELAKTPPAITGFTKLRWSYDDGLDVKAGIKVKPTAQLKFSLTGTGFAELNLYVKTITLWSRTWPLGEVAYQLPLKFEIGSQFAWNSKKGVVSEPADLLKAPTIGMGSDDFSRIVDGRPSTQTITTVDEDSGEVLPDDELVCREPLFEPEPVCQPDANASVNPKHDDSGTAGTAPAAVDAGIVDRLGVGMPLEMSTRGYFEQRMKADLTRVRIHTGPSAGREAERLAARAFTVGEHIAFAPGEFDPDTPDGQELIAHELAHVAQQQGGGAPIVLRWPAVTRTDAQTAETPASIRAMSLSTFSLLTDTQLDWATSPALQADAAALTAFRDIDRFAERPNVVAGAGELNVGDIIGRGIPAIYAPLEKYAEGAATDHTAWLRPTANIAEAEGWGRDLTTLEAAWPAANLSLVMRAPPDPAAAKSPFEKLVDPAGRELPNFISYLTTCQPVLSANNGAEVDSFVALRGEGALPHTYHGRINYARTYHHFTRNTLDGLVDNEAWPQWRQQLSWLQRPLTVVLYPAIDDNRAFHRNAGLEAMVQNDDILTIVIEGHATVADYQSQLAPVAARYGIDGEIYQAMVGGHGNSTVLNLAGSAAAAPVVDALGTTGTSGTNTTNLTTELTRLMSADPARRRIVLDACLTDSHHVATALRASPADAAADVTAAIAANPSLRDVVAGIAGAGSTVLGANASFAPAQTTFMTPGSIDIGLGVPGDPDLVASKLEYVEFGTEPAGCMRAMLECWAADQLAGTHDCRDAVLRRIGALRSTKVPAARTDTWRECIIQPIYDLAVNHYWGSGDAIRQLGELADQVFVLFMVNHTTPAAIDGALAVIAGNVAHVDRLFASATADPTSTGSMRVAITLEQVWMQYNVARRGQFMAELARYGSCALARPDLDMNLILPQVPDLLALPPARAQLMVALLAARAAPLPSPPPSPLPAHVTYLRALLGAGPTFPPAAGIGAALGPLGSESDILAAIGRPLAGGHDPTLPPNANINIDRGDVPDRNDFAVTPLRSNGVVATRRDDLMVRSRPTTATTANIFARLPPGTPVMVIGEYGNWYAIEQPGRTGFVAKRYITLLP